MKYFAELDKDNVVVNIFVTENDLVNNTELDKFYKIIEYSNDNSEITNNPATIGSVYDYSLNAFISKQPDSTYILNMETFEWEPDENLKYDLHGDSKLYRYCKVSNGWIPTWDSEIEN